MAVFAQQVQTKMAKEIKLTQTQVTLVDDEDYDYLTQWKWCAMYDPNADTYYAVRGRTKEELQLGKAPIKMHRVITNARKGELVDHISGNTLDNRKHNLRIVDNTQNQQNKGMSRNNTSGVKGVSWHKRDRVWRASISVNGKRIHLGNFSDKEDAIKAYRSAVVLYHGEFGNIG